MSFDPKAFLFEVWKFQPRVSISRLSWSVQPTHELGASKKLIDETVDCSNFKIFGPAISEGNRCVWDTSHGRPWDFQGISCRNGSEIKELVPVWESQSVRGTDPSNCEAIVSLFVFCYYGRDLTILIEIIIDSNI